VQERWRPHVPVGHLWFAAGLALGIVFLAVFGFIDIWAASLGQSDFSGFWAGPRAVLDGVNPYATAGFPTIVAKYGTQRTDAVYGYPPWDLALLLPFALVPERVAAIAWTAVGIGVAIYGLGTLLRREVPGSPTVQLLAGLALFASQPAIITFYSGQWGFLLLGALALSARWQRDGRSARAALAAIAMVAKPQLFVFAAWAMARQAVARGDRAFVAVSGIGGAVLIGVAWLAFPDWLHAFLNYITPTRTSYPPHSVTLATPLGQLLGPGGLWLAIPIIVVVLAVALRFRPSAAAWLPVWLAASITLTTYSWSYDHVVLIVPIVLAVGAARSPRRALTIGLVGFTALLVEAPLLYQLAVVRGTQSLNVLVPFTVLAVIVACLWPFARDRSRERAAVLATN